jgi:hypothetical protein
VSVSEDIVLVDPWEDLRKADPERSGSALSLSKEVRAEVSVGPPLHDIAFVVVGRSYARDDVLLKLDEGWALVHLTWSGHAEQPPWPISTAFHSVSDVEGAIDLL